MRRGDPRRLRILAILRSGCWLTPDRLRDYPALILAALVLAACALAATSHGAVDGFGRTLGTDFSGVWVAGREVLAGDPARPFDNAAHAAAQTAAFGIPDGFLPWPYPPFFLAVAAALATLPYLAALALWQGGTLTLYLGAVRLAVAGAPLRRGAALLAALAFPAVAINALHGQNGLLTAALVGFGAMLLPRRPLSAGVLLGLLAYKPQFALMAPLALLAGRHWRAAAAAGATMLAMIAATLWAYGPGPWRAFFANLPWMRRVVLEGGGLESFKMESAFAAVRLLGGSVAGAYALQGTVALAAAATLAWIWWRPLDMRLKLAALASATLLATPYGVDYDLTILGPALAALVAFGLERGFGPWEKSLLALTWAMPLVARPVAMALHAPLGFLVVVALHAAIAARAWREDRAGEPGRTTVALAA